jgi:hypothetical protein
MYHFQAKLPKVNNRFKVKNSPNLVTLVTIRMSGGVDNNEQRCKLLEAWLRRTASAPGSGFGDRRFRTPTFMLLFITSRPPTEQKFPGSNPARV